MAELRPSFTSPNVDRFPVLLKKNNNNKILSVATGLLGDNKLKLKRCSQSAPNGIQQT